MARYIVDTKSKNNNDSPIWSILSQVDDIKRIEFIDDGAYKEKCIIDENTFWKNGPKTRQEAKEWLEKGHFLNSLNATYGIFRHPLESSIDGLVIIPKHMSDRAADYFYISQVLISLLMED